MYETAGPERYAARGVAADSPDGPPVAFQRDRLNKLLAVNGELAEQLSRRLEAVLAPAPPEADNAKPGSPPLMVCPLAGEMRAQGDLLDGINTKLQRLLQRLEV